MKALRKPATRYEQAKFEFLRALRLGLNQKKISDKIGYSFNQYGKWESGHKQLKWKEFTLLCSKAERNIKPLLQELGITGHDQSLSSKNIVKNLLHKGGFESPKEAAKKLNISPSALNRWLKSQTEPTVENIFQLMDFHPGYLAYFLTQLLKGQELPLFQTEIESFKRIDAYLIKYPELIVLLGALQLTKNQTSSNLMIESLATSCGINLETCKKYLDLGLSSGLIQFNKGVYTSDKNLNSYFLFTPQDKAMKVLRSLVRLADSRTAPDTGHFKNTTGKPNYFFARLQTLTKPQVLAVQEILFEAAGKIEKICMSPQGQLEVEDLRLIHFNFFDLRDR